MMLPRKSFCKSFHKCLLFLSRGYSSDLKPIALDFSYFFTQFFCVIIVTIDVINHRTKLYDFFLLFVYMTWDHNYSNSGANPDSH